MSEKRISVLVLGGTGAMGIDLVKILAGKGYAVTVTSRNQHENGKNITYLKGNAKEDVFLQGVLACGWDCIVDFMSYQTAEFRNHVDKFLSATKQYIFISSARVYAPSEEPISEDFPRLLDVCKDKIYMSTDEYALSKARQENMLIEKAAAGNFTIIRPSLTYNSNRLQFALSEKEEWLYRVLQEKSIIFPSDMAKIRTTMGWGRDIAFAIAELVANPKAMSETVHITGPSSRTWQEILEIYQQVIEEKLGHRAKVYITEKQSLEVASDLNRLYQLKYSRGINRIFDGKKLESIIGKIDFVEPEVGLKECLGEFLDSDKKFKNVNILTQAYMDKFSGEHTDINEFSKSKDKLKYIIGRYTPYYLWKRKRN